MTKKAPKPEGRRMTRLETLLAHLAAGGGVVLMGEFSGGNKSGWCDPDTNRPISKVLITRAARDGRIVASAINPLTDEVEAYKLNSEWKPPAPKSKRRRAHDLGPASAPSS